MGSSERSSYTLFVGTSRIASGTRAEIAGAVRQAFERPSTDAVLVFDDETGEQVELDLGVGGQSLPASQPPAEEAASAKAEEDQAGSAPRGPGRPRLGVVAREVTLLPRHWEWLASQPGGASVALRKLVEQARKANEERDRRRRSQEAAYRFMSAVAGNLVDFEEAIRALFSGDRDRFDELTGAWPRDVSAYARALASSALA